MAKIQALTAQLSEVAGQLAGPQPQAEAGPSNVSAEPSAALLREAQQRANRAETQLLKLQRRLDSQILQSQDSSKELNRLAFQDPLTGLANANLLREHLEKSIRSLSAHHQLLVMVVDVDHFTVVNQTLGHEHGDDLLIRISERLHGLALELGAVVGRLSEDEFVLTRTVATEHTQAQAVQLAQAIRTSLSAPFMLQGQKIPLTVSQGGTFAQGSEDSGRELLQRAQTALAHAKKSGRDQFHLYSPEFEQHLRREASLEFQLGFAIDDEEFFLEYLPIVWQDELAGGMVQGRLIGVEALLRWRHRTEGVLAAGEFISAAELSGRVVAIGRQMFAVACRDFAGWRKSGLDLYLNFNLSGRELLEPETADVMAGIAHQHEVPLDRLTFEIREDSAAFQVPLVEDSVDALRAAGFSLALDQFGAGMSSLRRLSQVQFLKLSPRLLQGDRALLEPALALARGLGLVAIGVGVETAEQGRYLLTRGCPTVQGFCFTEPLNAAGVLQLCQSDLTWKI